MRPSEVFRIEVRNLDFVRRTIVNPFGKTKAATRTIPMTNDVCEILQSRSKEARGRWVFCSPAGPGRAEQPDRSNKGVRKAHDATMVPAGIQRSFSALRFETYIRNSGGAGRH